MADDTGFRICLRRQCNLDIKLGKLIADIELPFANGNQYNSTASVFNGL